MGNVARPPEDFAGPSEADDEEKPPLGDLLAGRFASVDVDSVGSVREIRESE